jgi:hypothetical protein
MNKYRNTYKEFFGLTEQEETKKVIPNAEEIEDTTAAIEKLGDAMKDAGLSESDRVECSNCKGGGCDHCDGTGYHESESNLTEAELINKMRDYKGGVEYVIYDPSLAPAVQKNIDNWATKKGFDIIKKEMSPSGKIGYFYFRLGDDQFTEAKKIQGYISQLAQIKHFRFNIRQKKQKINKPLK